MPIHANMVHSTPKEGGKKGICMTTTSEITQTDILRLADLVRAALMNGERTYARDLLGQTLGHPPTPPALPTDVKAPATPVIPTALSDLLGQTVARACARPAPGQFLTLLDDVARTEVPSAWPFIGSAIYTAFAHTMLPSAMQHARRHIARAAAPAATDAISERVPGQLLVNYFEEGLSQLYDWVSDPSPWVRRALGVAVHFYVENHPKEQSQIARLLQLLGLAYQESDPYALEGIAQGFQTVGKHQPNMLIYWLYEQREVNKQPHPVILRQATTYLPETVKAELLPEGQDSTT